MELRHLRYFVAVAEEGSFTRAAARLGIQQPPLSQQVKALEGELGLALLRRHARGVRLTPAGQVFVDEARETLARVTGAAERARSVARGTVGSLTVGLATSAATHRASPATIAAFRVRYPAVALSFIEGNAAALTEAVERSEADAALIRAPVSRPEGVRFQRLLVEPILVALPAGHARATRGPAGMPKPVALADLAEEKFILVRRAGAPGMYEDLVVACRTAGFEPRIAAEVGSMFINAMLVAAGVGVSVMPGSMRDSHRDLVAYHPLRGSPGLVAPLTLVTRAGTDNAAVAHFSAVAREVSRRQ